MSVRTSHATVWVRDHDEALAFFEKLGFEVSEDVRNGDYRWLAVASSSQPDLAIVLAVPGYPMDDETAAQVRSAVAKGMLSGMVFSTGDCFAAYEDLKARGVEFTRPAGERPYGVDAAFRDPSGNEFRLLQTARVPA